MSLISPKPQIQPISQAGQRDPDQIEQQQQLPIAAINTISSFSSDSHLTHRMSLVSKRWEKLFSNTKVLHVTNHAITDEELIKLIDKRKTTLTSINLSGCTHLTDKGIKYLAKLKNLTALDLSVCGQITDATIKDLSKLQNLTALDLSVCGQITDAAIKGLSKLQNLTNLSLNSCNQITDAAIKDLIKLKNLTNLNLTSCKLLTDAAIKDLSKMQKLTTLNLNGCKLLTDEATKDLSNLYNLTNLSVIGCKYITIGCLGNLVKLKNLKKLKILYYDLDGALNIARRIEAEKMAIQQFIQEKSTKFGIVTCDPLFTPTEHAMSCTAMSTEFQISINSIYLLPEQDIEFFLSKHRNYRDNINTFLSQKKPELLNDAAKALKEFASELLGRPSSTPTPNTILLAKDILIMHALGKLSEIKRFLITHELAHAHDYHGVKSLGDFTPTDMDFIQPHQYEETRADLTAARELHAHELGTTYFGWHSVIAGQPDISDEHPKDADRAKAIKIDQDKILKETS